MDPLENARNQIKTSFNLIENKEKNKDNLEKLLHPKRVIEISIPVKMDNWETKIFTWYRSQHSDIRWPFKGWIRFHQDVTLNEVKALSIWMTFKCSVAWIPLGWWKWWIIVNPKELSENELEKLSRWYVREIYKYIWPLQDVPAPDVNTTPQIMAWMMDEYSLLTWIYSPGSFTWKPISSGWSLWRNIATAMWWVYVLEKILDFYGENIKDKNFIVQWAWNAWLIIARLLNDKWWILIWISDSKWAIYNKNWLDLEKIEELKNHKKSVIDYSKHKDILTNEEILEIECYILIPAALENQITQENVNNIKAKYILELANWPTSWDCDEILFKNWINVIPDILANSWWVTVSYFEQVQNNINYYWSEKEVLEKLKEKMDEATHNVYLEAKKHSTYLRNWAYLVWLKKLFDTMNDRK